MCTALGSVISLLYVSFTVRSGSMRSFLVLSHDKVKTHKWHHQTSRYLLFCLIVVICSNFQFNLTQPSQSGHTVKVVWQSVVGQLFGSPLGGCKEATTQLAFNSQPIGLEAFLFALSQHPSVSKTNSLQYLCIKLKIDKKCVKHRFMKQRINLHGEFQPIVC